MASESWRQNLYIMFAAEFIVILGFSFIMPFMPLYVQELGSFNSDQAALWSGIAMGASSRALFGSAVIQTLAGLAPNIYIFVGLRFLQGLFSGTVPAASAMVASSSPRDKTSYAMGL